jgi:N utilization substance protein B
VLRRETRARARALQLLYAWEMSGEPEIRSVVARVAACYDHAPPEYARAADLAERAVAGRPAFDRRVAQAAEHWRFERVGVVERNILRLALAELAEGRTPARVVIDEAVRLAHWFAGDKAPPFVNGLLDRLAREQGAL